MTHSVKDLKTLIRFLKKERISKFKLDGFEFDLSGTDPKQAELNALRADLDALKGSVDKLSIERNVVSAKKAWGG